MARKLGSQPGIEVTTHCLQFRLDVRRRAVFLIEKTFKLAPHYVPTDLGAPKLGQKVESAPFIQWVPRKQEIYVAKASVNLVSPIHATAPMLILTPS